MSGTVVPPSISVWSNRTVDRACNGAATAPSLQFPHGGSTRRPPAAPGARGGAPAKSRRGDLDRWCSHWSRAACGGGGTTPGVAALKSKSAQTTATGSAGPGSTNFQAQLLEYAACMRKNGVPDFPDPTGSGAIKVPVAPTSPTFEAAQEKCQKVMPGGGPPIAGSATHPSAQALVADAEGFAVHASARHLRVPGPELRRSRPTMAGIRVVTDMHGVILAFPFTLDMWSAAFAQAEAACNFGMVLPERG